MDIGLILQREQPVISDLVVRSEEAGLVVLSFARPFGKIQVQAGHH